MGVPLLLRANSVRAAQWQVPPPSLLALHPSCLRQGRAGLQEFPTSVRHKALFFLSVPEFVKYLNRNLSYDKPKNGALQHWRMQWFTPLEESHCCPFPSRLATDCDFNGPVLRFGTPCCDNPCTYPMNIVRTSRARVALSIFSTSIPQCDIFGWQVLHDARAFSLCPSWQEMQLSPSCTPKGVRSSPVAACAPSDAPPPDCPPQARVARALVADRLPRVLTHGQRAGHRTAAEC